MEDTYLLKDGLLYHISGRSSLPLSIAEAEASGAEYQIALDDGYFFYLPVGKLNVSRKKVRAVVENYLQSMFPMELFAGFALYENKNHFIALVYKEPFAKLLAENIDFFRGAKKISTAFCELTVRYDNFLFTDGQRVYDKSGDRLEVLAGHAENALKAEDLWEEILPLKGDLQIKGIQKSKAPLKGYQLVVLTVVVCYLFFLAANIMSLLSYQKIERLQDAQLTKIYEQAGVAGQNDPYGTLLSMAKRQKLAPFRVMDVLHNLGQAVPQDIRVESFIVNERLVRIEGFGKNFASVEELKTIMESKLKKSVTLEDSRQAGEQVKFVIRYEP